MEKDNNWDNIYSSVKNLKKLPWVRTTIPLWFKSIVNSKWIAPCKTLDVGCGNGYFSYYLSKKGFKVTGIDVSKEIINYAKKSYPQSNNLKFIVSNFFNKETLSEKYNFILDIGLFHNILPEKRKEFSKRLSDLLFDKGKVLIFCFDKREGTFENKNTYFNSLINMYSYPLSKEEIIKTFSKDFIIEKIEEIRYGTNNYKRRYLCFLIKK